MNIYHSFTKKELELLNKAGVSIEDKEYISRDLNHFAVQVGDYIMSQSSKNGAISKATQEYGRILDILEKE